MARDRRLQVEKARREVEELLSRVVDPTGEYRLTYAEMWFMLAMLSASWAEAAVSDERGRNG